MSDRMKGSWFGVERQKMYRLKRGMLCGAAGYGDHFDSSADGIERVSAHMPMKLFDERAVNHFIKLKRLFPQTGTMDLRIASIGLTNNALLATRNLRDFVGIQSLVVEDWTKS